MSAHTKTAAPKNAGSAATAAPVRHVARWSTVADARKCGARSTTVAASCVTRNVDVARDGRRRLRVVAVVARAAAVVAERRRRRRASLADRRTVTAEAAAEGGVRVLRCAIVVVAAGGPR